MLCCMLDIFHKKNIKKRTQLGNLQKKWKGLESIRKLMGFWVEKAHNCVLKHETWNLKDLSNKTQDSF